jgi:CMP-N-acetylneuraminic acid synthetase
MFLEYPFVTSNILDDAIQTMAIFDLDSLISVRQDNSLFYNHDGKGMKAINDQDKFTRIEREAIYKFTAGLMLTKIDLFNTKNTFIGQRAGHIEVNQQAAMVLYTDFDVKMAKLIAKEGLKSINK